MDEDARRLAEALAIRRPCLLYGMQSHTHSPHRHGPHSLARSRGLRSPHRVRGSLFRVAGRVVRGAALRGFSFTEMAAFMYRGGDGESRSALENLCVVALDVAQHRTGRRRRRPSSSRPGPAGAEPGVRSGRRSPDVLSTAGSTHASDPSSSPVTPLNGDSGGSAPHEKPLLRSSSADAAPAVRSNGAQCAPVSASASLPSPATTGPEATSELGGPSGKVSRHPQRSPPALSAGHNGHQGISYGVRAGLWPDGRPPPPLPSGSPFPRYPLHTQQSKQFGGHGAGSSGPDAGGPREVVRLMARNGQEVSSSTHSTAPPQRHPSDTGAAPIGSKSAREQRQDCGGGEQGEVMEGEGSGRDSDAVNAGSSAAPRDSCRSSPVTPGADSGVVAGAYTWRVPAWEAAMECADLDPSRGGVVPSRLDATTTAVAGLAASGLTFGAGFLWEALRNDEGRMGGSGSGAARSEEGGDVAPGQAARRDDTMIDLSAPAGRGSEPGGAPTPSTSPDDVVSTQTALRDLHSQVRGKNAPHQATARREASSVPRRLAVPYPGRGPGQTKGLLRVASYDVSSPRPSHRFLTSPDERDVPFQWQEEHDGLEDQFLAALEAMLPDELARWKRKRSGRRSAR